MASIFPVFESDEAFDTFLHSDEHYRKGVAGICRSHHMDPDNLRIIPEGESGITYFVGDGLVLKMCPPLWTEKIDLEEHILLAAGKDAKIPTPRVIANGEAEGWKYLFLERLPGESLEKCWNRIPDGERKSLLEEMGRIVRTVHQLAPVGLSSLVEDWSTFVSRQSKGCSERHQGAQVDPAVIRQIPAFVEEYTNPTPSDLRVLHTELTLGAWRVEEGANHWRVVGLLDFGDALHGDPYGEFFATFDPELQGAFYRGYGIPAKAEKAILLSRFLANFLLHRYVTLDWLIRRAPGPLRATSLEDLAVELLDYN